MGEKKGRGWGTAGRLLAREQKRELPRHSHSSKDEILFLLAYSYY